MKALVVFYSRTGNTKLVAETIAQELNADIKEVEEAKKWRWGLFAYVIGGFQAIRGKCSQIKPIDINLGNYDLIFVGSPVWASRTVPAINAFISQADFEDKEIVAFFTMGGSRDKAAIKDMAGKVGAKSGRVVGSFAIRCGGSMRQEWVSHTKKEIASFHDYKPGRKQAEESPF